MNKNIYEIVEEKLKENKDYVAEDGRLLKAKVYSDVMTMNKDLIELILSEKRIKDIFFTRINEVEVFDKQKFAWFLESKEFLPDSYTRYQNKVGLTHDNRFISQSNDVVLDFPYKDCVLEFDSTDENEQREEIFMNEIIAKDEITRLEEPKVFTNIKRYLPNGKEEENITFNNDNLIIKGNNLIALYSLLPKYEGKIGFMYWDILYNTQSDKVPYNDSFKESSWLVMMKNRIQIAYKLLSDTGVLCLQCDDNEQAYLTVLCNEIFKGKEKRINTIVVEMASTGGLKRSNKDKKLLKQKEYILVYSKSSQDINSLYDEWNSYDGNYTITFDEKNGIGSLKDEISSLNELYSDVKVSQYLAFPDIYEYLVNNRERIFRRHGPSAWARENVDNSPVVWKDETRKTRDMVVKVTNPDNENEYEYLMRIRSNNKINWERLEPLSWNFFDGKFKLLRGDLWKDFYKIMGNVNKEGGVKLDNGKKPEQLIYDLISAFSNNKDDIILDAYLGTGTTAAVAHMMNRRYIGIEQLDKHINLAKTRMINVLDGDTSGAKTGVSEKLNWQGGGSYVYCELKDNGQELIDIIQSMNEKNIDEIKNRIYEDNRIISYITKVELKEVDKLFNDLSLEEKKKALINLVDKNKLYVNYSDIDDEDYNISNEEKTFTKSFYEGE